MDTNQNFDYLAESQLNSSIEEELLCGWSAACLEQAVYYYIDCSLQDGSEKSSEK